MEAERVKKFTRLTGDVGNVSGLIELRRLGKIRLGLKRQNAAGKEYPSETDYFVCPPEVQAVYGEKPTELDAMFSSNEPEEVYQEKLAMYGKGSGLKCHGNGETAQRRNDMGHWETIKCPCPFLKSKENPTGQCTAQGHLMVMLPKVPHGMWGNYQITTRSTYARAGILSSLKDLKNKVGRIAFIPLKLSRVPQQITYDGKVKTHYIVGFVPDLTLPQIIELRNRPELLGLPSGDYKLEGPIDTNPEDDPVDELDTAGELPAPAPTAPLTIDAADLADMSDEKMEAIQQQLNLAAQTQAAPPADPPAAEPPKEEPAPPKTDNTVTLWNDAKWADIDAYFASSTELCLLRNYVKDTMKFTKDLMRLNNNGRNVFMRRARIEAERRHIKLEV